MTDDPSPYHSSLNRCYLDKTTMAHGVRPNPSESSHLRKKHSQENGCRLRVVVQVESQGLAFLNVETGLSSRGCTWRVALSTGSSWRSPNQVCSFIKTDRGTFMGEFNTKRLTPNYVTKRFIHVVCVVLTQLSRVSNSVDNHFQCKILKTLLWLI